MEIFENMHLLTKILPTKPGPRLHVRLFSKVQVHPLSFYPSVPWDKVAHSCTSSDPSSALPLAAGEVTYQPAQA